MHRDRRELYLIIPWTTLIWVLTSTDRIRDLLALVVLIIAEIMINYMK